MILAGYTRPTVSASKIAQRCPVNKSGLSCFGGVGGVSGVSHSGIRITSHSVSFNKHRMSGMVS